MARPLCDKIVCGEDTTFVKMKTEFDQCTCDHCLPNDVFGADGKLPDWLKDYFVV